MSRARYLPLAAGDVDEISEKIAADNLDAAIRFCLAVEEAVEKLIQFPKMGARRELVNPLLSSLRSWPIKGFSNYVIFYMPVEHGIDILRIIHGARDLNAIFSPE